MITVNINNKKHSLFSPICIAEMLSQLNIETQGIAVAINNQIATKASWKTHQLSNGDKILIITATQGG